MTSPRRTERLPAPTHRHALTGQLEVSPYCLGMVAEPDTVLAAYDAGINFFFLTCDMHWPYYDALRLGLRRLLERGGGVRDRIVVALVSYVTQPPFQAYPYVEGLAAVPGLGHADVLVLGGVYQRDLLPRLEQARKNVDAGHVGARALGATFHERSAALQAARYGLVDLAALRYNPSHPGARSDVFPHLPAQRPLLYGFTSTFGFVSPARMHELGLAADLWRPRITDHYRFALSHACVDGLLCSPRTPHEVAELVQTVSSSALDQEAEDYLVSLALLDSGKGQLA